MKPKYYMLLVLSVCATLYGGFVIYTMLYQNRTPYIIECTGLLLDSNKVYAISNKAVTSPDTVIINFEQSRVLMPQTLGFLYFEKEKREFLLRNDTCIINPMQGDHDNVLSPFCRTLEDGTFSNGKYFNSNEIIREKILIENGIKYNVAGGDKENRVSIELIQIGSKRYLKTQNDGVGVKYLVQSNATNLFDVVLNQPLTTDAANVFYFDNTADNSGNFRLEVKATTVSAQFKVKDSDGNIVQAGVGERPVFEIGGILFSLKSKYSLPFCIFVLVSFLTIVAFQVYFLTLYSRSASPLVQALFSIRVLLNNVVFLGLPVFLTSYYWAPNRQYFLPLVLLLNFSFFISKRVLHGFDVDRYKTSMSRVAWSVIAGSVMFMALFAKNESLFGIPVLHVQKLVILLLIFATQINLFRKIKYGHWLRFGFIIVCSLIISSITKDIGSFIYTGLAFLLVELVRKSIKLRTAFIGAAVMAITTFSIYSVSPATMLGRKFYRVTAPYINPASPGLSFANQADRETYSSIIYNLKNVISFKAPQFNDVVIPAHMRSTSHSDFAFLWSLTFGGVMFFILFLFTVFILISNLILLLYCASRPIRIRQGVSFMLPSTREAEVIRFLLALSIIAFIYPVASNTLLIPLTGQSIPCLSISNFEVVFLIWLLISLGSIFTNPKYIVSGNQVAYYYGDAKMSMKYALTTVLFILFAAYGVRWFTLKSFPSSITWQKIKQDVPTTDAELPDYTNKAALLSIAKAIIGNSKLVDVPDKQKAFLKNINCLYYSGIPYSQTYFEPNSFSNSEERLLNQKNIDKIFDVQRRIISGEKHPFGVVYAFNQQVNNKLAVNVTNDYYRCIPPGNKTINTDLTAECNLGLEQHINRIAVPGNIGAVMIVENKTGRVIANSSFPLVASVNSNEVYYFIGSLKKLLVAYCALKIDPMFFRNKSYGGITFKDFVRTSDDFYAASALRDLLVKYPTELDNVLTSDFELPLFPATADSYFDIHPTDKDLSKKLDRKNIIYRTAIGQQVPYQFSQAMQFYVRVASNLKVRLNYSDEAKSFDHLSLVGTDREYLLECLNSVLNGTASVVRRELEKNNISIDKLIAKTGTAEAADRRGNSASSFVLSNELFTVGVMLRGAIPENNQKLAAKDLFIHLIPVFKKYGILKDTVGPNRVAKSRTQP